MFTPRGGPRLRFSRSPVRDELVRDLLSVAHARQLERADINEGVLAAIIWPDEAKTLGRIKPLH